MANAIRGIDDGLAGKEKITRPRTRRWPSYGTGPHKKQQRSCCSRCARGDVNPGTRMSSSPNSREYICKSLPSTSLCMVSLTTWCLRVKIHPPHSSIILEYRRICLANRTRPGSSRLLLHGKEAACRAHPCPLQMQIVAQCFVLLRANAVGIFSSYISMPAFLAMVIFAEWLCLPDGDSVSALFQLLWFELFLWFRTLARAQVSVFIPLQFPLPISYVARLLFSISGTPTCSIFVRGRQNGEVLPAHVPFTTREISVQSP